LTAWIKVQSGLHVVAGYSSKNVLLAA